LNPGADRGPEKRSREVEIEESDLVHKAKDGLQYVCLWMRKQSTHMRNRRKHFRKSCRNPNLPSPL